MRKTKNLHREALREMLMINFILIFAALAAAIMGGILLSYLIASV